VPGLALKQGHDITAPPKAVTHSGGTGILPVISRQARRLSHHAFPMNITVVSKFCREETALLDKPAVAPTNESAITFENCHTSISVGLMTSGLRHLGFFVPCRLGRSPEVIQMCQNDAGSRNPNRSFHDPLIVITLHAATANFLVVISLSFPAAERSFHGPTSESSVWKGGTVLFLATFPMFPACCSSHATSPP